VGSALSYDEPARRGERLPDVSILLGHEYRSYERPRTLCDLRRAR
jgi:hypothetical protein